MNTKLSQANLELKKTASHRRWWLTIPAGVVFFASLGIFIFCSLPNGQGNGLDYDWNIAVIFGKFFHHPFGNFLAHWAVYTGDKMLFLAVIPAVMIIVETYFLKAKTYKPEGFFARNQWLLFLLYLIFFVAFISLNVWQICYLKFGDRGWGVGVNTTFVETYEKGFIFRIVFFVIGFSFHCGVIYFIHFHLARRKLLLKEDYWVPSLKILMFAAFTYATVGIIKVAMGRPYYLSNIYENNPDGGWSIREELSNKFEETYPTWRELPYMRWWEPYRPFPHWHELITFNFDSHQYNNDFPSGHIASCAIFLSLIFYGLDKPRKTWRYKAMIGFSYLMLIQFIAVYFGMVIYRMHWLSDMAFTALFMVPYWRFSEVKVNAWFETGFFTKHLPLLSKNDKIRVAVYKAIGSF